MRWVICALVSLAFAQDLPLPRAFAPDLRRACAALSVGPATFTRWSGFYFGGQFGYGERQRRFHRRDHPLIAYSAAREHALETDLQPSTWPVLGTATAMRTTLRRLRRLQHAMAGPDPRRRRQLQPHAPFAHNAPSTPIGALTTSADLATPITVSHDRQRSARPISDYGVVARRAPAYVVGNFLPYGFAGSRLGRDINVTSDSIRTANAPTAGACRVPQHDLR